MNTGHQNLHTHTTYCDGKLTAPQMVKAAIEKGGGSLGFSEHSFVPFDEEYSMALSDMPSYIQEINSLKTQYADKIDIFLGIEQDYFTNTIPKGMDYIIGSVHHVEHDGKDITIDGSYEHLQTVRDEHFGGDFLAVAEAYYAQTAKVAQKTNASIIGHFDLIAKQNAGGRLFDEKNPRYVRAATDAMECILEKCRLFEVSTGAMYRLGKAEPYPSIFLLKELFRRKGEVILSSDSHDAASLYYKFDEMRELLKSCGFKRIKRLTKNGFADEML
ncbi:MAG: histidinol-phosphatase [Oscillospiraceae bacterium]|nr:histidinol-phosphatase [Oscillospiraceae bacterium]